MVLIYHFKWEFKIKVLLRVKEK